MDYQQLLERHLEHEQLELQKQEEEDEALVKYASKLNYIDMFTIYKILLYTCIGKCSMIEEGMPVLSGG